MDLSGIFTPAAIADYWAEAGSNSIDYLGPTLFPPRKKAGLDLRWIKGAKGLPISLMPSAFDAKATYRDRIGVEITETEMPFFREGFKIKERDRQEILKAKDLNDPYVQEVLARLFDDAGNLIAGANVVPEREIFQLLFPENGNVGISIKANGVDYTYNYDPSGTWKASNYTALTGADLWTASTTADPFSVFQQVQTDISGSTGAALAVAIMNTYTFNLMAKTDALKNRWLTTAGRSMGYLTKQEAAETVRGTSGLQVIVYDKQYQDESRNKKAYVPDGYVCLIPMGELGSTCYGTTPEEADLQASPQADVSIVNTGVAISRIIEPHPVNTNILASEIVLPSFERMDEVAVIKVAA